MAAIEIKIETSMVTLFQKRSTLLHSLWYRVQFGNCDAFHARIICCLIKTQIIFLFDYKLLWFRYPHDYSTPDWVLLFWLTFSVCCDLHRKCKCDLNRNRKCKCDLHSIRKCKSQLLPFMEQLYLSFHNHCTALPVEKYCDFNSWSPFFDTPNKTWISCFIQKLQYIMAEVCLWSNCDSYPSFHSHWTVLPIEGDSIIEDATFRASY